MKHFIFLFSIFYLLVFSNINTYGQKNSIKGLIVDSLSESLPGVLVIVDSTKYNTITDVNGAFYLFNIPDGKYKLTIKAIGFKQKQIELDLKGDELIDLKKIKLSPSAQSLEEITIQSTLKGEAESINLTKTAPQSIIVTSAEEIAKLPNKNGADVVSHNPSVATQRNKGEGHIVSIRGTPSDWSSVLINGNRLPVACEDNTTRSFEFEAFPSALVDQVIESKTISSDMESDNIGGTINFSTKHPEYKKTFNLDVAGGMSLLAKKPTGTLNFLFGNVSKNKKWSYIVNTSFYGRYYAADASKVIYGSNVNQSISRLELRKYEGLRTTIGTNVGIEYKPNNKLKTGIQAFRGLMIDDKQMRKESFNWIDESGHRIRLQNTYGKLYRQITGLELYTEYKPKDRITINAKIASYINEFKYGPFPFSNKNDSRNGNYVMEFMSSKINFTDFSNVDLYGNSVDANSQDYIIAKLAGKDNPYDNTSTIKPNYSNTLTTQNFEYSQSYTENNHTRESDPIVGQVDLDYKINNRLNLQSGIKYRYKSGYRRISQHQWLQDFSKSNSSPILLSEIQTQAFTSNESNFLSKEGIDYQNVLLPFPTQEEVKNFNTNYNNQLREVYMNEKNPQYQYWVGSNYQYKEKQLGGYSQLNYQTDLLNLLGGFRLENTNLAEESDTLSNKQAYDASTSSYYYLPEKRFTHLNYFRILPSINSTFYLKKDVNLRLAASRTMHRPNFEETKPGHAVIRYNDLEYTFGNPNLKPTMSINLDASVEKFYGLRGMWSLGTYFKKITNHIYASTTPNRDPASGLIIKQYNNAPKAWVLGFEGVFIRKFTFLNGFWNGFGINANVSYCLSQMQIASRSKSQPMTYQTPLLYNVSLIYEKYNFNSKLALGYNGSYLTQINLIAKNSDYDIYMGKYYSLDYQISYDYKEKYTFYIEANNLLNSPERRFRGQPSRLYSVEYYRLKAQIGFRMRLEKDK